jgi:DNA-binding response OmpR family regulator
MRVLIVESNPHDVARIRLLLQSAGHEVEHVVPSDPELREAVKRPFDLVVVEWGLSSPELIRLLGESSVAPSVLVCSPTVTPEAMTAIFATGAEDFIKTPFLCEELVGRVARIARTRSRATPSAGPSIATVWGAREHARTTTATRLSAWAQFNALATECLSCMTMLDLMAVQPPAQWTTAFAASVPLAYTPEHLEFRVAVDGGRGDLETFATAAIGMSTPEAISDLLNEMANVAGGAFVRAALDEGLVLTNGLPTTAQPGAVEDYFGDSSDTLTCWLSDPSSKSLLRVRLAVCHRGNGPRGCKAPHCIER